MTVKTERDDDGGGGRIGTRVTKKTLQVRDVLSQPTGPLNDSAKLCLVEKKKKNKMKEKKIHPVTDVTVPRISGRLIEAGSAAVPFYTHLQIGVISICLLLTG